MGGTSSKLKKEIELLKANAAAITTTHNEQIESLKSEKRMLEYKLHVLEEIAAKAQVEADQATQVAIESEEKMKVLKWELVRTLSVVANTPNTNPNTASQSTTSPRVALNWKVRDGVTLRRSSTTVLHQSRNNNEIEKPENDNTRKHDLKPLGLKPLAAVAHLTVSKSQSENNNIVRTKKRDPSVASKSPKLIATSNQDTIIVEAPLAGSTHKKATKTDSSTKTSDDKKNAMEVEVSSDAKVVASPRSKGFFSSNKTRSTEQSTKKEASKKQVKVVDSDSDDDSQTKSTSEIDKKKLDAKEKDCDSSDDEAREESSNTKGKGTAARIKTGFLGSKKATSIKHDEKESELLELSDDE